MFFTQETPAKVMSLLGTAMFSMLLLFGVSYTSAGFAQTEKVLPDMFSPGNVMAVIDSASHSYSEFLYANLIHQAQTDYALAKDNLAFVMDEAAPSILAYTGLTELAEADRIAGLAPAVAGAYTYAEDYQSYAYEIGDEGFSMDTLYNLLTIQ